LGLPKFDSECPYAEASGRNKVKDILDSLEGVFPKAKQNIFRSLKNIRREYLV
jgi:tRNA(Ile)-lysidine synthase TilS/MesJ